MQSPFLTGSVHNSMVTTSWEPQLPDLVLPSITRRKTTSSQQSNALFTIPEQELDILINDTSSSCISQPPLL